MMPRSDTPPRAAAATTVTDAFCLIRPQPHYRREAFLAGLAAAGLRIHEGTPLRPGPSTLLVIWNRYGSGARIADQVEAAGGLVIVAENAYLPLPSGEPAYALALDQHNGAGRFMGSDGSRFRKLGFDRAPIAPWRYGGDGLLVLGTRGIGPAGVAEPAGWSGAMAAALDATLRRHPGNDAGDVRPLEADLEGRAGVVTWGSTAALKAMLAGYPIAWGLPGWIGGGGRVLPTAGLDGGGFVRLQRDYREAVLFKLSWAMWTVAEIERGEPFRHLLAVAASPTGVAA